MTLPPMVRDEDWFKRLTAELQLRGASGREIGETVATVDEYCRDSGQLPSEAFGNPVTYAASLRPRTFDGRTVFCRGALPIMAAMVAAMISMFAPLTLRGTVLLPFEFPAFIVIYLVVGLINLTMWPRLTEGWRLCAFIVLFTGARFLMDLARGSWLVDRSTTVPAWLSWLGLAVALAWATGASMRAVRNRVVDPRTGRDSWDLPGWAWAALPWLLPLGCAGVLGVRLLAR